MFKPSANAPTIIVAFVLLLVILIAGFTLGQSNNTSAPDTTNATAPNASSLEQTVSETLAPPVLDRQGLVADFLGRYTGGTVALEEATGKVVEYTLEINQVDHEIAPGVVVEQWAFGFPGETPSVPGPQLRAEVGDLVRVTMVNNHSQPHTLHLHGIVSSAQQMDGTPHTSHQVLPGEAYTYEFVAMIPGTHVYHCHVQTYLHMDMGMYGTVIIEPKAEDRVWDTDTTLVLDEIDSDQNPLAAVHNPQNNHFLINGKAFPLVENVSIPEGEVGLVRLVNMGYELHSMHLHGNSFLVLAKDGYDLDVPYQADTIAVAPGERYDILIKGRDGDFPFHDHIVSSVTNNGVYPGGMHVMVTGSEQVVVNPDAAVHAATAHAHADTEHAQVTPVATPATELSAQVPVREGEVSVRITNFAFDTPVLRIKRGTTVTWTNDDAAPHTVTSGLPGADAATRAFDSSEASLGTPKMMNQGDSWSYTFDETGEFDYYCLPHTFMTAKVIVE